VLLQLFFRLSSAHALMKLHPGLEIRGPCCRDWHVLFQPDGWEHDTTASRNFLYWRCAKNASKGAYYAGSIGQESDRHQVLEPEGRRDAV